ncbi:cell division protein FtsZ [Mycoplasmoides genitalium]
MDENETQFNKLNQVKNKLKIGVFGIGGAGNNIVDASLYHYPNLASENIHFYAINSDLQHLAFKTNVKNKLLIQDHTNKGFGAGGDPAKGASLAISFQEQFNTLTDGYDFCILVAGFGKGTGTGATSVFSKILKTKKILNVAIVTYPSLNEGLTVRNKATKGLEILNKATDSYMLFCNEKCTNGIYQLANTEIVNAIKNLIELITIPLQQNIDFEDVRAFFQTKKTNQDQQLFTVTHPFSFSFDSKDSIEQFAKQFKNFEKVSYFDHSIVGAKKVLLKANINQKIVKLNFKQIQDIIWTKIDNYQLEIRLGVDFVTTIPNIQIFILSEHKNPVSLPIDNKPTENNQNKLKLLDELKELGMKYVKHQNQIY